MLDIVVIAYEKEVSELLLLLTSIDLFFDKKSLGSIHITTQENNNELKIKLTEIIEKEIPVISERVKIRSQLDVIGEQIQNHSGWYIQQFLKLKTSVLALNEYTLVLDCKNHFINSVSKEDFFRGTVPLYYKKSVSNKFANPDKTLARNFINSFNVFDLNYKDYIDDTLGILTPFIFKKHYVLEMISFLEDKFKNKFHKIFFEEPDMTEFFLYTAFLYKKDYFKNAVALRNEEDKFTLLVCESNTTDLNYINWIKRRILDKSLKIFGIHKLAYGITSNEVKAEIRSIWEARGLLNEHSNKILSKLTLNST